ncbi:MAG: 30S ribosomal protein S17 [Candidatus Veblenbacteria bacterium]|nr:30S ribosomal protein S17 [Candidatus Veblenbacteria bacterium]MDZ4229630.1 30S ribosomal protein S17 [Candidatus Veblenbacteria bacterium]
MTPEKAKSTIRRHLTGVVVAARTDKTRQVEVTRVVAHVKYGKRYRLTRRFAAHDESNSYALGDRVVIEACRPYSKTKRWRIVEKLAS